MSNLVSIKLGRRGTWHSTEVRSRHDADKLRGLYAAHVVVLYDASDVELWRYLINDILEPMCHGQAPLEIYRRQP